MPYTTDFASARCLTKLHQPQDVDVVSQPSQYIFLSLADLPRRRVPTFDIPNISLISLALIIATHSGPQARCKARGPI